MILQYIDNARIAEESWFEKLTGIDLVSPTPREINSSTLVPDGVSYVVQRGEHKTYWHGVTFNKMLSYSFLRLLGAAVFAAPSLVAFGIVVRYPAMGATFLVFSVVGLIFASKCISEICNIRRVTVTK